MKPNVTIDITVTGSCNKRCSYCFEHGHTGRNNPETRTRELRLVDEYCRTFDSGKFNNVMLSFWGGEPLLDIDFMLEIIDVLRKYDFVKYILYSNGTLVDNWKKFISDSRVQAVKDRFQIQLSYDGKPHNALMRGYDGKDIFQTAELLRLNGFDFNFKATLSLKCLAFLPEIWDSYYRLYLEYPENVRYCPTLDVTSGNDSENLELWRSVIQDQILKREFAFLKKYRKPLWTWFEMFNKGSCSVDYRAHLHDDGKIYVCHGCPYSDFSENMVLGDVFEIEDLSSLIKANNAGGRSRICEECDATYCAVCHALNVDKPADSSEMFKQWNSCKPRFENKCKYYRIFGHESRVLNTAYSQWLAEEKTKRI